MFSPVGILEPVSAAVDPPGTHLFDPPTSEETAASSRLKRHPRHADLILRPQPSSSLRDPLNWSRARKEASFFVLMVGSILTGVIGPILVPAFSDVAADLGVPVAKVAQLNGILVLFEGVFGILFVISSSFIGRRHVYLACALLQFVGCIWGGQAQSYNSLYGARVLMGAGMAAFAVSLGQTIVDMFYTYEHGARIALWQVTYCASVNIAPIISAYIAGSYGWRRTFDVLAAFEGAVLVGVFFLCPETMYGRSSTVDASGELVEDDFKQEIDHIENPVGESEQDGSIPSSRGPSRTAGRADESPLGFVESLKVWSTGHGKQNVLVASAQPFAVVLAPQIFWAMLAYTQAFSWFVGTGATYGQIYSGQYYQESVQAVGLISGIAPLIGSIIACVISGPLTDYSARWLSKRNHGIFEPEFRLVVLIPAIVCISVGGYTWAYTTGEGYSLMIGTVMGGIVFCGATLGVCATVGYANACYPSQSGATFAVLMLLSRVAIFGQTYIWNDWLASHGVEEFFTVFTSVSVGLWLFGGVVWVFGKVTRAKMAQNRLLGWACR
ncbi:hypothetical protein JCM8547_006858 [Rhodosporidiobolus lusitaniae]